MVSFCSRKDAESLTTRRYFELLDAIGPVWSKNYSHDAVSLRIIF